MKMNECVKRSFLPVACDDDVNLSRSLSLSITHSSFILDMSFMHITQRRVSLSKADFNEASVSVIA